MNDTPLKAKPKTIGITLADGTNVSFAVIDGVLKEINSQPTHASIVRNPVQDFAAAQQSAHDVAVANGWI